MTYDLENTESVKKLIVDTIDDLLSDFFYYDRKEDHYGLYPDKMCALMKSGVISKDFLIEIFSKKISEQYE